MRQKQALEDDAAATKKKMEGANALLGALAGEEARWTEQSKAFDDRIQRLTGRYHNPLSAYSSHFKTSKPGSAHCQMAFGAASFTVIKDGLFAISIGYMGALATDVLDS